ncbi:hypothetical protein DQ238_17185 [Geodermatophilus sp. TF02-6]|uniref:hypothetical protein n=1 Tax=Geodermatophilus sp. TF02-6 TaxID=2250575 RepID=UPI000DEB0F64|nr:hypothetical protein [Geodermatophilus sp. TF02-6]RBY76424.1 hypothetical protein DQ238_17185 [Geodermatophilus sp. TF02-6]
MTTTTTAPAPLLRAALRLDAGVSGLNGAAYLLAAAPLADLLGLPPGWLRGTGVFLLVFAAAVWLVADRPAPPAVRTVVAANALWSAGSVVVVAAGLGSPTTVGAVWLVLQTVVVAAFAVLQAAGLRRS